jgi:hypothetical protein
MEEISDVQMLIKRIERLEKRDRRWKLASAFVVLAATSLMLMGAKSSVEISQSPMIRAESVEARDFILKDEGGRVRARLSLDPGEKSVRMNGQVYRNLPEGQEPRHTALQFYNDKGEVTDTIPAHATFVRIK